MTWQIQIYSILDIRILSHYFSYVKLASSQKIKQLPKVARPSFNFTWCNLCIFQVIGPHSLILQVLSEMSYKHVLKPLNKPAF